MSRPPDFWFFLNHSARAKSRVGRGEVARSATAAGLTKCRGERGSDRIAKERINIRVFSILGLAAKNKLLS